MHNPMETLLALKCRNCYGDELLMRNGEGDSPCPDCHHPITKQPTGKLLPKLMEECKHEKEFTCTKCFRASTAYSKYFVEDGEWSCQHCGYGHRYEKYACCQGTGFVPVSEDTATVKAMEWLTKFSEEAVLITSGITPSGNCWSIGIAELDTPTLGATPLEALAAAIKASVEAG